MSSKTVKNFAFASPHEALDDYLPRLRAVEIERVALDEAHGRVLAEPIVADRPSPPCDVSAMDGYALRLDDLKPGPVEIAGEARIGQPPPALPAGKAILIVTGAPVPAEAQTVVMREWVEEREGLIIVPDEIKPHREGQNIRRQGENLGAGQGALEPGGVIGPAVIGALAAFGVARVSVFRKVRVGALVTGDELAAVESKPADQVLRDSNGPALQSLFSGQPWTQWVKRNHARDDRKALRGALGELLERCDAVFLSGGVSMGDYDYVPGVIRDLGAEVIFHKLPVRPGKPVLAAVGPNGQAIFGLPGNPVSVLVSARRLGAAAVRRLAGFKQPLAPMPAVSLGSDFGKPLDLWWYRLVRLTEPGKAAWVQGRGSGDFVGAARADGFVEIPPGRTGPGPWPFYSWGE